MATINKERSFITFDTINYRADEKSLSRLAEHRSRSTTRENCLCPSRQGALWRTSGLAAVVDIGET